MTDKKIRDWNRRITHPRNRIVANGPYKHLSRETANAHRAADRNEARTGWLRKHLTHDPKPREAERKRDQEEAGR